MTILKILVWGKSNRKTKFIKEKISGLNCRKIKYWVLDTVNKIEKQPANFGEILAVSVRELTKCGHGSR